MRDQHVVEITDCSEFRQTLQARPPAVVHGTVLLLVGLLGSALAWAAWTEADLVVLASGHVRPVSTPRQVFIDYHGDSAAAGLGVAVAEVHYRQGDEVNEGDVLLRMDTRRLEAELNKRRAVIRAAEADLERLEQEQALLEEHSERTLAEAAAELAEVEQEIDLARRKQAVALEIAARELAHARAHLTRTRELLARQAASAADVEQAEVQVHRAGGELARAKLPVPGEKAEVCRRKLARLEQDFLLKRAELGKEQSARRRELEAAAADRDRLGLELRQAVVTAPVAGVVTSRELKPGDIPEPGKPVVEIAGREGFRFEAAISSEDVAPIQVGMPVRIKLDAYDYQKYGTLEGEVCFVSPDAKVVAGQRVAEYAVKVELHGGEVGRGGYRGRVRLGMAGQAEILTERESVLSILLKKIRRTVSLG